LRYSEQSASHKASMYCRVFGARVWSELDGTALPLDVALQLALEDNCISNLSEAEVDDTALEEAS
jgi:hypothetical protein